MSGKQLDEQFGEQEAARRRDEVLRRMLNTPPKPFTPKAKPKRGKRKSQARKSA